MQISSSTCIVKVEYDPTYLASEFHMLQHPKSIHDNEFRQIILWQMKETIEGILFKVGSSLLVY